MTNVTSLCEQSCLWHDSHSFLFPSRFCLAPSTGFGGFGAAPQPGKSQHKPSVYTQIQPCQLLSSFAQSFLLNACISSFNWSLRWWVNNGSGIYVLNWCLMNWYTSYILWPSELWLTAPAAAPTSLFGSTTPAPSGNLFGSAATPGERCAMITLWKTSSRDRRHQMILTLFYFPLSSA